MLKKLSKYQETATGKERQLVALPIVVRLISTENLRGLGITVLGKFFVPRIILVAEASIFGGSPPSFHASQRCTPEVGHTIMSPTIDKS